MYTDVLLSLLEVLLVTLIVFYVAIKLYRKRPNNSKYKPQYPSWSRFNDPNWEYHNGVWINNNSDSSVSQNCSPDTFREEEKKKENVETPPPDCSIRFDDPPAASYYNYNVSAKSVPVVFDDAVLQRILSNSSHRKSKYSSYYNAFDHILSEIPRAIITVDKTASPKNINISGYSIETETVEGYCRSPYSYVVLDVETTGLVPGRNKIIQISAIRFSGHKAESIFNTYVNPSCKIPPESTRIHGITDEMVKDSPKFHQILNSLEKFIGNNALVGHNLIFDIKFLRKSGYDNEIHMHRYYDTLELSRFFDTTIYSHSLSSACEHHNIISSCSHNSEHDALMTALLFQKYIKIYTKDTVVTLDTYNSLQKALFNYQSAHKKG